MSVPAVSIIIPVYNSEDTILQCLASIREQTFVDYEVIIVDDGSTDRSIDICRNFHNDERFKLIERENKGAGSARNFGVSVASGTFLMFVDSDDWCHPSLVETLLANINKYGTDVSACGNFSYDEKQGHSRDDYFNFGDTYAQIGPVVDLESRPKDLLRFSGHPWAKLFRRETVSRNSIRFSLSPSYQDTTFVLSALITAKKISVTPKPLYYYRIRAGSISKTFGTEKIKSVRVVADDLFEYARKHNIDPSLTYYIYVFVAQLYVNAFKKTDQSKKHVNLVGNELRKIPFIHKDDYRHNYALYSRLRNNQHQRLHHKFHDYLYLLAKKILKRLYLLGYVKKLLNRK